MTMELIQKRTPHIFARKLTPLPFSEIVSQGKNVSLWKNTYAICNYSLRPLSLRI